EEVTKYSFRSKMWDYMKKNGLVSFPLNIHNRIPNFKGAIKAAQRLTELEEFKKAKTIEISPDKPQKPVRYLALVANKEILVPIPRLRSGLFLHIKSIAGATKAELKTLSTIYGLKQVGKPVGVDSDIKVDLVVLGSVCVSREGYRLGKGEGFADLEFAMMVRMGAITENTKVITTVHDCQIVDDLPSQLFKEHDVPVDIIITPTQTIIVQQKAKKYSGIIWEMLSQRKLATMPVLRQLKEMDEKEGKMVILKEVDSDTETKQYYKNHTKRLKYKKRFNPNQYPFKTEDSAPEEESSKEVKKPFPKKRYSRKIKKEENIDPSSKDKEEKKVKLEKSTERRKYANSRLKSNIDFSLKLSNISYGVRVRDLKNALLERGVKPNEIIWQGYRGICYLHFNKLRGENISPDQPVQVDSIVANLQQLRIGDSTDIIVKPAKPISRIEVTDVSAV
ncbi:methenyltetrahydrofolate synthase domain-containing protein, partial [Vespula squamosa]